MVRSQHCQIIVMLCLNNDAIAACFVQVSCRLKANLNRIRCRTETFFEIHCFKHSMTMLYMPQSFYFIDSHCVHETRMMPSAEYQTLNSAIAMSSVVSLHVCHI